MRKTGKYPPNIEAIHQIRVCQIILYSNKRICLRNSAIANRARNTRSIFSEKMSAMSTARRLSLNPISVGNSMSPNSFANIIFPLQRLNKLIRCYHENYFCLSFVAISRFNYLYNVYYEKVFV